MTVDYHDFTTQDTPKDERRKLNVGDIYINSVKCNNCGVTIRSKNRHDMVSCKCNSLKRVSVDGGSFYSKISYAEHADFEQITVYYNDVELKESENG